MLRSRANEIPALVRQLGSRSPQRIDAARARLSIIGARAVDDLIEALEGTNNRVRSHAMPLLAMIQDPRGREPLLAMLLSRLNRIASKQSPPRRYPSRPGQRREALQLLPET